MTNERDPAAAMAFTLNHRIDRNDAPALPKNQNDAPAMPKKWNDALALLKKQSICSRSPLNHPRAFKCSRHWSATVIKKKTTRRADRVLVKRALAPPGRRPSRSCHRRRIFRPTPSRLSKMSMAWIATACLCDGWRCWRLYPPWRGTLLPFIYSSVDGLDVRTKITGFFFKGNSLLLNAIKTLVLLLDSSSPLVLW